MWARSWRKLVWAKGRPWIPSPRIARAATDRAAQPPGLWSHSAAVGSYERLSRGGTQLRENTAGDRPDRGGRGADRVWVDPVGCALLQPPRHIVDRLDVAVGLRSLAHRHPRGIGCVCRVGVARLALAKRLNVDD